MVSFANSISVVGAVLLPINVSIAASDSRTFDLEGA
jgi:hypothetical protein